VKQPTYFPDGYTRRGYIKAEENHYGSLAFTYRPALVEERDRITESLKQNPSNKSNEHIRGLLKKQLHDWDLVNDKDQPVEVNAENIRRLHPIVYDKLYLIVTGQIATDPLPQPDEEQQHDFLLEMEALATGRAPGDVKAESDLGNSAAA
jgi:hypothetical protein